MWFDILLFCLFLGLLTWVVISHFKREEEPPIINVNVYVEDQVNRKPTTDNSTTTKVRKKEKPNEIPIEEPDRSNKNDWLNINPTDSNL